MVCADCLTVRCERCSGAGVVCLARCYTCLACRFRQLPFSDDQRVTKVKGLELLSATDSLAEPSRRKLLKHAGTVTTYARWARAHHLVPFPLSSQGVLLFLHSRLLDGDADSSTLLNNAASLSAFHTDLAQALQVSDANPVKHPRVKFDLQQLERHYKKLNRARRPLQLYTVRAMALHCWHKHTRLGQFHALVLLFTACGFLRKHAATQLVVAVDPSGAFDPRASSFSFRHCEEHGDYVHINVAIDKNVAAGWPRNTFVPGVVLGDIPLVEWLRHYLKYHRLRDPALVAEPGYLLSAPAGNRGIKFRSNPYTATDSLTKSTFAAVLPEDAASGDPARDATYLGAYSLRKSLVQALYDHMSTAGHQSINTVMGDVVGWLSVKSEVTRHYASLSARDSLGLQLAAYAGMPLTHSPASTASSRG